MIVLLAAAVVVVAVVIVVDNDVREERDNPAAIDAALNRR